jgi:dTDP-4-amino-4,6-dideoxygalactose transaminase
MSCFSTYIAHIISTIEGGIVLTDNSEYADILRSLRTHGRACKCEVCVINLGSNYCKKRFKYGKDIRFVFERVGFSSKMNEIEAAVGIGNIEIFDKILKQRRKNLISLMKKFKEFGKYFYIIEEKPFEKIAPHGFPLVIKEKNKINRNELIIYLAENGIDTRDLFSSIPTQCDGYKFLGYRYGEFPIAEYIGENGLHFGVHQDLNEDDIEYIFNTVKRFIKEKL